MSCDLQILVAGLCGDHILNKSLALHLDTCMTVPPRTNRNDKIAMIENITTTSNNLYDDLPQTLYRTVPSACEQRDNKMHTNATSNIANNDNQA